MEQQRTILLVKFLVKSNQEQGTGFEQASKGYHVYYIMLALRIIRNVDSFT